jgi:polyhydroxyalkanoate synthesis regulator phasin
MFRKKMAAGILTACAIILSSSFALAAPDNGTGCPEGRPCPAAEAPADPARFHARVKNALDALVKDGTISKEQENAILKAFEAKRAQFEKEREKLKKEGKLKDGIGKPKRKPSSERHGVLKELVDEGVITKEQADAIRKAISELKK